ncbi:two-pore potassium channel 1 isoform X2 [Spinacia oleracea]|uniref:Two-pore potassium channel 1 isoform X2 n=1 Tax=Spinacia oleracea TaxID=3562 RepID=A0ABM3QPG0_SPIOL|nr:two-pore potassium channel 1-like isoform X2 [Spinacia oleracea]
MANHDTAKTPFLGGSINDAKKKQKEDDINFRRIRFRHTKSNPSIHYRPPKIKTQGYNPPEPPPSPSNPSEKPVLFHVFLVLALYLVVGTFCFVFIRGQLKGKKTNEVVDALYFCIVTMTTVGYGDLVPATTLAKLLSSMFVFSGMAIVGMILSKAADYIVEKNEALVVKAFNLQDEVNSPAELLQVMPAGTSKTIYNTLGYGDESFATSRGRLFAVFWILSSTICLAQFFFYLTELYTERRQKSFLDWVLTRKLTHADIEAADLDDDNVVSAAEFVIMKLKEMEKITAEDVTMLMECFRNLDADDSGTLTAADIVNTE